LDRFPLASAIPLALFALLIGSLQTFVPLPASPIFTLLFPVFVFFFAFPLTLLAIIPATSITLACRRRIHGNQHSDAKQHHETDSKQNLCY
jgi:hypothetical protein